MFIIRRIRSLILSVPKLDVANLTLAFVEKAQWFHQWRTKEFIYVFSYFSCKKNETEGWGKWKRKEGLGLPVRNCIAKGGDKFIDWVHSAESGYVSSKSAKDLLCLSQKSNQLKAYGFWSQEHHLLKSQAASKGPLWLYLQFILSHL